MDRLLAIVGPTATGKTALGLRLAARFGGELVSADSRQVYRGMDIGTGKDLPAERQILAETSIDADGKTYRLPAYSVGGIPVWMYDVVSPDEPFSVALYRTLARAVIRGIVCRGKLPIVVGGTGLYVAALTAPAETYAIPPDYGLRKRLEGESAASLADRLRRIRPDVWETMNASDRNNPRRLLRKIEIAEHGPSVGTGEQPPAQDVYSVGLTASREMLYARIDERVDRRVACGALAEVADLIARGYGFDLPSMSALGYRDWRPVFAEHETVAKARAVDEAVVRWKYGEHAYARRQLTWFRAKPDTVWFDVGDPGYAELVEAAVTAWYTGRTE